MLPKGFFMTPYDLRQIRRLSLVVSVFFLSTASGVAKDDKPQNDKPIVAKPATRTELVWKKRSTGSKTDEVVTMGVSSEKKIPKIIRTKRDEKGKAVAAREVLPLSPKLYYAGETYYAELDTEIRNKTKFLHFILSGTAKQNPGEGTIINIDGAILGFTAHRDEATGRGLARIVTLDELDGNPVWVPVGVHVRLGPQDIITGSPPLAVRLDHKHNTWALFASNLLIAEGLPLFSEGATPTVSIRAGQAHGDMAVLKHFQVHDNPGGRDGKFLPSVNGKIDLEKAFEEGNPLVRRSGGGPIKTDSKNQK